ncbi:helveticin J family class III bacteriocin [Loigolactobacillus jiayinensis]|uniref:Helveticin J family class III bacteriocin n=1 Tax=Loigolactobacillus jiayinensis TaxID=2486016 RepID=A0ABW1R8S7_9LACO|nr:helveticin J family class III bacteriocin [Loigolactobacillus jiayinensis]
MTLAIACEGFLTLQGLPLPNVVQTVHVSGDYIYACQYTDRWRDARQVITKCRIEGPVATAESSMTLHFFGHGQTLQWFQHREQDYFWVVCQASKRWWQSRQINWGVQIGRLQYQANQRVCGTTRLPRLTQLNAANQTGHALGQILRCEAALASDGQLLLWTKNQAGSAQFAQYNAAKLNMLLDQQRVVACSDPAVVAACTGSYAKSAGNWVPYNSYQGLALAADQTLYVSSGGIGQIPYISAGNWHQGWLPAFELHHPDLTARFADQEIEGLQVCADQLYVTVTFHANQLSGKAIEHVIYRVSRHAFTSSMINLT